MDKMSIINILTVGVPEILLSVIIMLLLIRGKINFRENILINIFKCILSTVFILGFIYLIRKTVNSIVLIAFLNTLAYSACMYLFWKFNLRQSLISASLSMFIIIIAEIITVAPTVTIIVENILQHDFMDGKLVWSLPTRLIQILIIIIISTNNATLENNTLLNTNCSDLSNSQKRTSVFLIILVFISIIFSTNYAEFYVKMKINNIDTALFSSSMFLLLIQSIIYLIATLVLLNRTSKYEDYKNILHRNPSEIIEILTTMKGGDSNEKKFE